MYLDPTLVPNVNNGSTETNPSINVQTTKSMEPSPKKTIIENLFILVIKSLYENVLF